MSICAAEGVEGSRDLDAGAGVCGAVTIIDEIPWACLVEFSHRALHFRPGKDHVRLRFADRLH